MRFGKTVAQWFFKQSNEIHGGVPPTLDNIKTEADLVTLFVDILFFHRTQLTHKTKCKYIIAVTVLRFHDAFLGILGYEPSGKYKYQTHQPFHHFWDMFLYFILLWFLSTHLIYVYDEHFDSEYSLDIFLENYKFDELSKILQCHCKKNNTVNTMAKSNNPMNPLIFQCG